MLIGSYPYLLNPSGVGGLYAATVASQPVQAVAPVQGQSNSAFIKFGGALSDQTEGAASVGQTASGAYTPGSTLNISV
jgi:hypothetical protein